MNRPGRRRFICRNVQNKTFCAGFRAILYPLSKSVPKKLGPNTGRKSGPNIPSRKVARVYLIALPVPKARAREFLNFLVEEQCSRRRRRQMTPFSAESITAFFREGRRSSRKSCQLRYSKMNLTPYGRGYPSEGVVAFLILPLRLKFIYTFGLNTLTVSCVTNDRRGNICFTFLLLPPAEQESQRSEPR